MYICVCEQVTEKQIKIAIREGAASLNDLSDNLGVASQCGQCSGCVKGLLEKHTTKQESSSCSMDIFHLFPSATLA